MKQRNQIDNKLLREAGVELMKKNKMPLGNITRGNSMIGLTPCKKSVRIRTSNDHRLIITANQPDPNASLNIEGTYWLLMVMPERERTFGKVIGYLIPTAEIKEKMKISHEAWLGTKPQTSGNNQTWTLEFNKYIGKRLDRHTELGFDFFEKWKEYRLKDSVGILETGEIVCECEL